MSTRNPADLGDAVWKQSSEQSRTREKALTPTTMGVGTILEARSIVLLVTGEGKATVLAKAVEGPVTSMISASALQLHPHCHTIVDEAAAVELTQKDYYRWIFENEEEWQKYR